MKFKPKINVKLIAENYGTESTLKFLDQYQSHTIEVQH